MSGLIDNMLISPAGAWAAAWRWTRPRPPRWRGRRSAMSSRSCGLPIPASRRIEAQLTDLPVRCDADA